MVKEKTLEEQAKLLVKANGVAVIVVDTYTDKMQAVDIVTAKHLPVGCKVIKYIYEM